MVKVWMVLVLLLYSWEYGEICKLRKILEIFDNTVLSKLRERRRKIKREGGLWFNNSGQILFLFNDYLIVAVLKSLW